MFSSYYWNYNELKFNGNVNNELEETKNSLLFSLKLDVMFHRPVLVGVAFFRQALDRE
jgi:hypothetical protein